MLENSLKVREKYVNKIRAKVDGLIESVNLLEKVDRQLLKNQVQMGGARLNKLKKSYKNLQSGGASGSIDFKAIQEAALAKKAEILLHKESIQKLNENIDKLSKSFEPINAVLANVKKLIDSIDMKMPDLKDATPPGMGDWSPLAEYNIFHNKAWSDLVFVDGITAGNDPKAEINFDVFNKRPEDNSAQPINQTQKDSIMDHLKNQFGPMDENKIIEMYCDALRVVHGPNYNLKCGSVRTNLPVPELPASVPASGSNTPPKSQPENLKKYHFF